MNKDFRVSITFFTHPKTLKLKRMLGGDGVLAVMQLWAYAAASKADGNFTDLCADDISLITGWRDGKELLDALIAVGFMDAEGDSLVLHDWYDNNPWAATAPMRSKRMRELSKKRWERRLGISDDKAPPNASRICATHCETQSETDMQNASPPRICKTDTETQSETVSAAHCETHGHVVVNNFGQNDAPIPSPLPLPIPSPIPIPSPLPKDIIGNPKADFDCSCSFFQIWKEYPNKDGKKEALKHYKATVKGLEDEERIKKALKHYKAHLIKNPWKQSKNGDTWFNNWQDWEDWKEPDKQSDSARLDALEQLSQEIKNIEKLSSTMTPEAQARKAKEVERLKTIRVYIESGAWTMEDYGQYLALIAQVRMMDGKSPEAGTIKVEIKKLIDKGAVE